MSYSVANINNLRLIYCNSTTAPQWEAFKNAILANTNNAIDRVPKYGIYFSTLLNEITTLLNCSLWQPNYFFPDSPTTNEKLFEFLLRLGNDNLATFIGSLTTELTKRFSYELLRLSESGCKELASIHCRQIKECLLTFKNRPNPTDLLQHILKSMDPDPKDEINKRIQGYINERRNRMFRSGNLSRESFLGNFRTAVNQTNVDVTELIDRISHKVKFKNDWLQMQPTSLAQNNASFSFENPFINGLDIYGDEMTTQTEDTSDPVTFNTPFFTAFSFHHISLIETTEDILLLLMRLFITQISANSAITQRSITVINNINTRYSVQLRQTINQLANRLHNFQSARAEEIERRRRINEMLPQSGV